MRRERGPIVQKVSQTDPEYRSAIEEARLRGGQAEHTFGENVLLAQGNSRLEMVSKSRQKFYDLIRDPAILLAIAEEIKTDQALYHELAVLFRTMDYDFDSVMLRLYSRFKKVPDKLYIRILQCHGAVMEKRKEHYHALKERWEGTIKSRFFVLMQKYGVTYRGHVFDDRINQLVFSFFDPLLARMRGAHAHYRRDIDAIENAIFEKNERGERILDHEILHALSGQTIVRRVRRENPYQKSPHEPTSTFGVQRVGLHLFPHLVSRFFWMNEGVTERLARELGGHQEFYYAYQQDMVKALCTKGRIEIPFELFVKAYFERYDTRKPYGKRIRAWDRLRKAINGAYDEGFLIRLDNFITREKDKILLDEQKKRRKEITTKDKIEAEKEVLQTALRLMDTDWRLIKEQ